jgi:hypothetical protein
MGCFNAPFMDAMVGRAEQLAAGLSLHGAATALWAMGRLRYRNDAAFDALARKITWHAANTARAGDVAAAFDFDDERGDSAADSCIAADEDFDVNGFALQRASGCAPAGEARGAAQAQADPHAALSRRAGTEVGRCFSLAVHACATLRCGGSPDAARMARAVLRFGAAQRAELGKQALVNMCWAAAVLGLHADEAAMAPLMQEALTRSDEMNALELAQLAQIGLALRLEARWYAGDLWMQGSDHASLLSQMYRLDSARCARANPANGAAAPNCCPGPQRARHVACLL